MQCVFTHRKLMDVARKLYMEHGWQMPRGLAWSEANDPANFSLAEWQQAKRRQKDPRTIKTALQDALAISDSMGFLILALKERGYLVAGGVSASPAAGADDSRTVLRAASSSTEENALAAASG